MPAAGWGAAESHIPVLYHEALDALRLHPGGRWVDGTVGAGGHAAGILERSAPDGLLLGLDRDPQALQLAARRLLVFGQRAILRRGSFAQLGEHLAALGWPAVDGVLLDLGLSSMQLQDPGRGFSFQRDAPLDMRFDPGQMLTAADLVNDLPEAELADLIRRYGEEPRARRIARAIVAERPIRGTQHLAQVVARAAGRGAGRIHPATRTFQALRIVVNDELGGLERGLEQALQALAPGGRLVVIAFHSLEDRIVKRFMRRESQDCICPPEQPACTCGHRRALRLVTRKPIRPGPQEVARNPRARSARMRVAERLELA